MLLVSISPIFCGTVPVRFRPRTRSQLKKALSACLSLSTKGLSPKGLSPKGLSTKGLSTKGQCSLATTRTCLLDLRGDDLVPGTFLRRPSKRNKSPYVADVELEDGREAIAHDTVFDMGKKLFRGVSVLLKPARDRKGALVGSDDLGPYGTPKCEFICQLARVQEPENKYIDTRGVWVGAHQTLGEKLTHEMLKRGLVKELGELVDIKREVAKVCGTDMRVDFVVTHKDGTRTALEVKTAVDTDYNPSIVRVKDGAARIQYWGVDKPYRRAAIFPWGESAAQRGPDGEKVVSARAIKHIDELGAIQAGKKLCPGGERLQAAILFLVTRSDALSFRPNTEACPSFTKHLHKSRDLGVKVMAYRVAWGSDDEEGVAFFDGALPVDL